MDDALTPPWIEHALAGLRDAGLRRGGAREAVVRWLGVQTCCRSALEIHEGVRADGRSVGVASVYRILDTLTARRLVQRVDVGDGTARFEPASAGSDHHHHLVCDDCGAVEPFHDDGLEQALELAASRLGVAMEQHEVVLHGACERCRAA
jgi:Fur family transcriptional regulator, ferric uptake regulator